MKQKSIVTKIVIAMMFVVFALCAMLGITTISASAADTTAVNFTYSSGGAQDNLKRYVITVTTDVDMGSSTSGVFAVTKDGESMGNATLEFYRDTGADATGKTYIIVIPFDTFVTGATTSADISAKYQITMEAGAALVNGTHHTATKISYVISGNSIADASRIQALTLNHKAAGNQPGAKRYLITIQPSVDIGSHGSAPVSVSKNGAAPTTITFDLWREHESEVYLLVTYEKLYGDASITSVDNLCDSFELTIPKGTLVGDFEIAEDVVYIIRGGLVKHVPVVAAEELTEVTFTVETNHGAQDNLVRYALTATTDIDVGGSQAVMAKLDDDKEMLIEMYYEAGALICLFPYGSIEAGVSAGASMGTHTITIEKGTQFANYKFANTLIFNVEGANFEYIDPETLVERAITVTAGDNGTATAAASAHWKEDVVVTVTPNEGYEVDTIKVNGEEQSLTALVGTEFKFSCPKADVAVEVTFKKILVSVELQASGVELASEQTGDMYYGDSYTFTITAIAGFTMGSDAKVLVNGAEVAAVDGKYTITFSQKANVITVEGVTVTTYTVTFVDGETTIATETVNYNSQVEAPTAPTKEGYNFIGWYLGEAAYDFDNIVSADLTLVATWEEIPSSEPEQVGGCGSVVSYGEYAMLFTVLALSVAVVLYSRRKSENK